MARSYTFRDPNPSNKQTNYAEKKGRVKVVTYFYRTNTTIEIDLDPNRRGA